MTLQKGTSNVSHNYDTVSRATTRNSSRETYIVSPESGNSLLNSPPFESDTLQDGSTETTAWLAWSEFQSDVARVRNRLLVTAAVLVFFVAPLAVVGVMLWWHA